MDFGDLTLPPIFGDLTLPPGIPPISLPPVFGDLTLPPGIPPISLPPVLVGTGECGSAFEALQTCYMDNSCLGPPCSPCEVASSTAVSCLFDELVGSECDAQVEAFLECSTTNNCELTSNIDESCQECFSEIVAIGFCAGDGPTTPCSSELIDYFQCANDKDCSITLEEFDFESGMDPTTICPECSSQIMDAVSCSIIEEAEECGLETADYFKCSVDSNCVFEFDASPLACLPCLTKSAALQQCAAGDNPPPCFLEPVQLLTCYQSNPTCGSCLDGLLPLLSLDRAPTCEEATDVTDSCDCDSCISEQIAALPCACDPDLIDPDGTPAVSSPVSSPSAPVSPTLVSEPDDAPSSPTSASRTHAISFAFLIVAAATFYL